MSLLETPHIPTEDARSKHVPLPLGPCDDEYPPSRPNYPFPAADTLGMSLCSVSFPSFSLNCSTLSLWLSLTTSSISSFSLLRLNLLDRRSASVSSSSSSSRSSPLGFRPSSSLQCSSSFFPLPDPPPRDEDPPLVSPSSMRCLPLEDFFVDFFFLFLSPLRLSLPPVKALDFPIGSLGCGCALHDLCRTRPKTPRGFLSTRTESATEAGSSLSAETQRIAEAASS
mmetsp:Transcript_9012/g.20695  ORF Transcript_9012/g.20695 Transcript_9012/m.20695 type:complete len:226 (+) Transcript_9012:117-794(+)